VISKSKDVTIKSKTL